MIMFRSSSSQCRRCKLCLVCCKRESAMDGANRSRGRFCHTYSDICAAVTSAAVPNNVPSSIRPIESSGCCLSIIDEITMVVILRRRPGIFTRHRHKSAQTHCCCKRKLADLIYCLIVSVLPFWVISKCLRKFMPNNISFPGMFVSIVAFKS